MEAQDSPSTYRPMVSDSIEDEQEDDNGRAERVKAASSIAIDRPFAAQTDVPRRIHIVGTGSIGKLVAHSLRGTPNPPPITLVFHRYKLHEAWQRSNRRISLQDGEHLVRRSGYDAEWAPEVRRQHKVPLDARGPDLYDLADETGIRPHELATTIPKQREESSETAESVGGQPETDYRNLPTGSGATARAGRRAMSSEPIHNLIVATKTIRTIPALLALRHRISKNATICFLQNGMGVVDEVNAQVFPDEAERPTYIQGIITHGANVPPEKARQEPFYVVHAGHGTIALGIVSNSGAKTSTLSPNAVHMDGTGELQASESERWAPSARYLLRTLTQDPVLCAVGFTSLELLQQQLEKLAVNSILNPMTVLLDDRNGSILYNFALGRTMRLMLAEISLVIRSLPELRGIPTVPHRFSAERLESLVVSVANKTKDNISSMLADVRNGRPTEIDYINGYIVRRGEELGIKCVVNYAIMQLVKGKALMVEREIDDAVPVAGSEHDTLNRE